jgi:hypothetical protein
MVKRIESGEVLIDLSIPAKKVCHIIALARDVREEALMKDPDQPESESERDEADADALTESDGELLIEMKGFISSLTLDEQIDLVALMWTGRDDGSSDGWQEIRANAADAHNNHSTEYLCGSPLLADHLTEGLSQLGIARDDEE